MKPLLLLTITIKVKDTKININKKVIDNNKICHYRT